MNPSPSYRQERAGGPRSGDIFPVQCSGHSTARKRFLHFDRLRVGCSRRSIKMMEGNRRGRAWLAGCLARGRQAEARQLVAGAGRIVDDIGRMFRQQGKWRAIYARGSLLAGIRSFSQGPVQTGAADPAPVQQNFAERPAKKSREKMTGQKTAGQWVGSPKRGCTAALDRFGTRYRVGDRCCARVAHSGTR